MLVRIWNGKEYTNEFNWILNSDGTLTSIPINDYREIVPEEEIVNQDIG